MKNTQNSLGTVVIGAGIVGICCALRLQLAGHKVVLVDKQAPACGASKGNAGHFAVEQVFPLSNPSTLKQLPSILLNPKGPISVRSRYLPQITPWLLRFLWAARKQQYARGTETLRQLNSLAMSSYEALLQAAQASDLVKQDGYILAFDGTRTAKDSKAEFERLKPFELNHQLIDQEQLHELEPNLKNCTAGIYFPAICYTTDPYELALRLFDCFVSLGGEFKQQEILDIQVNSEQKIVLQISDHQVIAEQVVLCAGIFSKEFVNRLGHDIPLDTERGYHQMLDQQGLLRRPVAFASRKFIATPMTHGTRLAGTVEFGGTQLPPNWHRADMLVNLAKSVITGVTEDKKSTQWMGFRPSLPDSLPVIDRDPQIPNLIYAFGHQHLGLTQAAITSELVESLLQESTPKIDLSATSIQRFA